MQAADAFRRADGATFDEKLENLFDLGERDSGTLDAILGLRAEGLLALDAAKALATVSVGSEPLRFSFASGADHELIVQQLVVVVNAVIEVLRKMSDYSLWVAPAGIGPASRLVRGRRPTSGSN